MIIKKCISLVFRKYENTNFLRQACHLCFMFNQTKNIKTKLKFKTLQQHHRKYPLQQTTQRIKCNRKSKHFKLKHQKLLFNFNHLHSFTSWSTSFLSGHQFFISKTYDGRMRKYHVDVVEEVSADYRIFTIMMGTFSLKLAIHLEAVLSISAQFFCWNTQLRDQLPKSLFWPRNQNVS